MNNTAKSSPTIKIRDIKGAYVEIRSQELIQVAQQCIIERFTNSSQILNSPTASRQAVQIILGTLEHEVFMALWLDNRHRVITHETLFRGTIDSAAVYPREVVKSALQHNAAAVIFAHNHPSGLTDPSQADIAITKRLKDALDLIDIRTLDHLIIGETVTSMAEMGMV